MPLLVFLLAISSYMYGTYALQMNGNAGPGIYGIAGEDYVDGSVALVKYNLTTGKTTTIRSPTATNLLAAENEACFDNKFNLWYFMSNANTGGVMHLNPYNLNDPDNRIPNIRLPQIQWNEFDGAGTQCAGDPNTGDIYVFGHSSEDSTKQLLLRIVRTSLTENVTITQIGSYDNINNIPLAPTDEPYIYDSKRNSIWFPGHNDDKDAIYDYYINATNGDLINSIPQSSWPIPQTQYNNKIDEVVGVHRLKRLENGYWSFNLVYVDPVSLQITKQFDAFKGEYCSTVPMSSIDLENQIFYSLLLNPINNTMCGSPSEDVYLLSINITDGTLLNKVKIAKWDPNNSNLTMPSAILYWNGQ